jgi:hypothetical protein
MLPGARARADGPGVDRVVPASTHRGRSPHPPCARRGYRYYLPIPEPGRVVLLLGPSVEVPGVAPVPCWLLTPPPTFVPVVPCIPVVADVEPVPATPPDVPVEPPDEAPAEPPAEPPPAPPPCAIANEVVNARTDASTAVLSFIDCPFIAREKATIVSNARS